MATISLSAKERVENALVILLMLLALGSGLAWLHSDLSGYQRTWSDSNRQSCGRFASLRGRILWQSCELATSPLPEPMSKWRLLMPPDFVVGSNPAGERMIITCAGIAIPFAFPQPGSFGWETRFASSTDGQNLTRWSARWSEDTISYRVLLIVLALGPAAVGMRRLFNRIKLERWRSRSEGPN